MIALLENGSRSLLANDNSLAGGSTPIDSPDTASINAQAAYQIALTELRLHRNRWKAAGPDQAGVLQEPCCT
jgi:hypothetical protein